MNGAYKIDIPMAHANGQIIKCEKCKIESSFFYVSIIDKSIICPSCCLKEKESEEYRKANEINKLAILRGDFGFAGIKDNKKKEFKIEI